MRSLAPLAVATVILACVLSACGERPGPTGPDGTGTVTLTGSVVEGSATPLPGALVELTNGGGVVTTGPDGRFSMPGVQAGLVFLRASKHDYSTATSSVLATPDNNPPFRFSLVPMPPIAVAIAGRVTDGSSQGVAGALVSMTFPIPISTLSDSAGHYSLTFSVRPPDPTRPSAWWGPSALRAEKDGHESDERYVPLTAQSAVDFLVHPMLRVAPGASARLAVSHRDPSCEEFIASFTSDPWTWPCRTVRMTPTQSGTLNLDLDWDTPAVPLGLQVRDGRTGWRCCDTQQTGRVEAGTELRVEILLRQEYLGSVSGVLRTSMTPD